MIFFLLVAKDMINFKESFLGLLAQFLIVPVQAFIVFIQLILNRFQKSLLYV